MIQIKCTSVKSNPKFFVTANFDFHLPLSNPDTCLTLSASGDLNGLPALEELYLQLNGISHIQVTRTDFLLLQVRFLYGFEGFLIAELLIAATA